jgi:tetratricopeptide (TPR) repeat protein
MHSMDYLVYAYLQTGQAAAARAVRDHLAEIEVEVEARTLPLEYARSAAPARFALEQRHWSEASALTPLPSRFAATMALTHYARALGFARSGTVHEVEREIVQLRQIRDALLQAKQDYWAKQVEVQLQTAQAWLAWAAGNADIAVGQMRSAVALEESTYKHPITPGQLLPARELLADLLLETGQPAGALREYEADLRLNPNRFNALYGAARAAELAGRSATAAQYYRQLLDMCRAADGDREELRRARQFLAGL